MSPVTEVDKIGNIIVLTEDGKYKGEDYKVAGDIWS